MTVHLGWPQVCVLALIAFEGLFYVHKKSGAGEFWSAAAASGIDAGVWIFLLWCGGFWQ